MTGFLIGLGLGILVWLAIVGAVQVGFEIKDWISR